MKHLERLKKLLNLAQKLEWIARDPFVKFSLKFVKSERAYLSQDEVNTIQNFHFEKSGLDKTRNIFIFACYTGLSYIDVKNLTKDSIVRGIDGSNWIYTTRQKTNQIVRIPLLETAEHIIEKYKEHIKDNRLLPVYSNQKINDYRPYIVTRSIEEGEDIVEVHTKLLPQAEGISETEILTVGIKFQLQTEYNLKQNDIQLVINDRKYTSEKELSITKTSWKTGTQTVDPFKLSTLGDTHSTFAIEEMYYLLTTSFNKIEDYWSLRDGNGNPRSKEGNVMELTGTRYPWTAGVFPGQLGKKLYQRMAGDKRYELSNHLGNVLSVVSDKKIPKLAGSSLSYFNPDIKAYNDYYPFGMLQPGRHANTSDYRYGFNGKENDDEVLGEGNWQDYGMRMYNPAIGRFPNVDPISYKYPMLSPYQFASNSPILGIDQDGLELENANARAKVARYGVDALKIKRVDDGWGRVQSQLYSLRTLGSSQDFTKLRETFLNNPQSITNNFYATYAPVQKAKSNTLTSGDEIGIDVEMGVIPVAFKMYVRVMDVQSTANSFKMTFATLEGHTDAGYITFSGSFNEKTGELSFNIFNETRENHGMGYVTFAARAAQIDQWEAVMGNLRKFLGKEKDEVIMTENIKEYKYDGNQPMGKGELVDETIKTIDE